MTGQVLNAKNGPARGRLTGWHVLFIMLGFFGVMFAVNGVFLYHAITSFPGEDVKKSYLQGLDYNSTLQAKAAQQALGWQAAAGVEDDRLVFRLSDATGESLSSYHVTAQLRRAACDTGDQMLVLQPSDAGEYVSDVSRLEVGRWDVRFEVLESETGSVKFIADKRITILP